MSHIQLDYLQKCRISSWIIYNLIIGSRFRPVLKRKIYDRLIEWKSRKDHNCLLVKGQRQVGKTYIIKKFACDNYEKLVYIDFSLQRDVHQAFDDNLDVDTVVRNLKLFLDPKDFIPDRTLIFFDEIQACPRARESLKPFSIDGRYDVIASGSLLDVVDRKGTEALIPVGYEEPLTMYGLDFEEFLWAKGVPDESIDEVRDCIRSRRPFNSAYLKAMEDAFRDYCLVGGMPQAVVRYLETNDYTAAGEVLDRIIESSVDDIRKYNDDKDALKIEHCFRSIPSQLSQSNKRYMFSRLDDDRPRTASRKYSDSLLWVLKAGLASPCIQLDSPEIPLIAHCEQDVFRVYMSDTGMLLRMMGVDARRAVYSEDTRFNMGAATENAISECLMKGGYDRYFYKKNKGPDMMEIDFIIELGSELVAIEVKSGKTREAPSIGKIDRFHKVDRKMMFCKGNISMENGIEMYPLFAAAFMKDMEKEWDGPALRDRTIAARPEV